MTLTIRPVRDDDVEALVALSLLAWEPVFASFERILDPAIYPIIYPDWHKSQQEGVEAACRDEETFVGVAVVDGVVVGFAAYKLHPQDQTGEVDLLAVHPDYQNQGVGTALNDWALDQMRASGMRMAVVGTGGDPSHAPARRSYEKAGYVGLPLVRYYKDL
ncbi:MAG: GNAT family N-acetyltransferase [Chloroflexi bacterium]|nr:GNAT family N-acetyltransferase [Chloroflexota bacterium]MBU1749884.1 GNAT family N-acetyltransferase [Chloroflexota bacterium]MBU1879872.1 GNAT family N-acetyltransferase [Chloroflexota bacterium]